MRAPAQRSGVVICGGRGCLSGFCLDSLLNIKFSHYFLFCYTHIALFILTFTMPCSLFTLFHYISLFIYFYLINLLCSHVYTFLLLLYCFVYLLVLFCYFAFFYFLFKHFFLFFLKD
uniref:Uncharacterized protein n=1 Tax=Cacopsylla melanoneura TaxID=428564 RepID=A0A8D8QN25_9HEMI